MELDGESEIRELRLPWPVYNNLFMLISVNDNNFEVKCKLCVNSKMYSTSTKSNSNLKKHITSKHASKVKELEADLKIEKSTNKRKNNEFDCDQSAKVQQTISDAFSRAQPVSQENLNSMITEFVIMGNHAFNIVEEEKFKIIIQKGFPNRQCLSRKTLMSKISTTADNLKANLKAQLSSTEVKYVCATAVCWSVFKRSYIGITVHWYDPESFQRLSAALACRRIKGRHTFDVLAKIMHDVIYEYGIFNKIIKIVTDNGSNFIKAFRVYSESENADENMEMEEEQEVELIAISDILNEQTSFDADSPYSLPPHHRCASHTLNLVATKDSEKALSDPLYKKQLRSTFAKMRALWNKQERTSLIADTIHDELNIYIIVPNATRWNSTFQAVKCLKDQLIKSESEVQRICDKAGLPRFDKKDQAFMIDYCKVMQPLAQALDLLQGDKFVAMGYLIPTIKWLKKQLKELLITATICKSLANACLDGVCSRFDLMLLDKFNILATVSHPKFKFKGMSVMEKEEATDILQSEIEYFKPVNDNSLEQNQLEEVNDNIIFDEDIDIEYSNAELERFLFTPFNGDLTILKNMPIMRLIFLKYNTALPSSASVERLFSIAGDICTKKRSKISDYNFENALLFKINLKNKD